VPKGNKGILKRGTLPTAAAFVLSCIFILASATCTIASVEGDHVFLGSEDGKAWYLDKGRIETLEGNMLQVYVRVDFPANGMKEVRLWLFDPERSHYRELDSYTYSEEGALVDQ